MCSHWDGKTTFLEPGEIQMNWFLNEALCFHCDGESLNDCDLTLKISTGQVSGLLNSQAVRPVLRNAFTIKVTEIIQPLEN